MGGVDKAMLQLAGKSLIGHCIARLEPQVERLAISANGDLARFSRLGLPVLPDAEECGPLAGILAALKWAGALGATAVVSVAVDTPFFPGDLTPSLCLAAESAAEGLAMAHSENDHPTCGLWPVRLAPALRKFLASGAKARVLDFANTHHAQRAVFPDATAFHNVNTPDDLAQAEAMLRGAA